MRRLTTPTPEEARERDRLSRRKLRASMGGRTDNDLVSSAVEHRLARWARDNHRVEVEGLPRHRKAAWVRAHYPDMVDETREQVRQTLNLPLRVRP